MKKKILLSLLVIISLFLTTGCGKKKEEPQEEEQPQEEVVIPQVEANQELGWVNLYVPTEFTYQPDLRGLAYSENDRKIFTKGDYKNRNDVIIIDVTKLATEDSLDTYVEKVNNNIKSNINYIQISDTPAVYGREKYEGKVDDTIIYNYTYLTWYNSFIYNITISGPLSKDDELYLLKMDILKTLKVGE